MDLRRFLDLYVSEAQEHVRLLHRSLLALEAQSDSSALDEAFRAAHTLKGISAAMGYAAVADIAHHLEDRLEGLRAQQVQPDAALIDQLLADADALEAAIGTAVAAPPSGAVSTAAVAATPAAHTAAVSSALPADTHRVVLVRLRADAPIKSARALLILRALPSQDVLGTDPTEFTDEFDGNFRIFFAATADLDAAEATIAAGGEVESVQLVDPARAQPAAPTAVGPLAAPRQLRVDAARLDTMAEGIAELSVLYSHLAPQNVSGELRDMLDRLGRVLTGLQHDVLALRLVPVREVFDRLPRVVRDAARMLNKEVELVIQGDDVQLDRAILDEISEPLMHLLRNAVDHGIGTPDERVSAGKSPKGRVIVRAERERSSVRIIIEDDGRGIARDRVIAKGKAAGLLDASVTTITDDELFRLLSHAGFSTKQEVSSLSGRGVGMDVVVTRVRALGGAIEMHTLDGAGTTFSIRLPITLAIAEALRVRIGGEDYAIPLTHVSEAVELNGNRGSHATREMLQLRMEYIPIVRLRRVLQLDGGGGEQAAVIAEMGDRRAALAVDELVGREQILVKTFDPVVGMLPYFSGATLLADGRPALVLDPLSVI